MNGSHNLETNEQGAFIASQVADFTNDKLLFKKFLVEVSNPKVLLDQNSVKDNLALVQIIVKAGLHLLNDGSSLHSEHEILFASSLSAISTIIGETPQILVVRVQSGALAGQDELWSWLLHHLLELLGMPVAETMSSSVGQAIGSVLSGLRELHPEHHDAMSNAISLLLRKQAFRGQGYKTYKAIGEREKASESTRPLVQIRILSCLGRFASGYGNIESLSVPPHLKGEVIDRLAHLTTSDITLQLTKNDSEIFFLALLETTTILGQGTFRSGWLELVKLCFDSMIPSSDMVGQGTLPNLDCAQFFLTQQPHTDEYLTALDKSLRRFHESFSFKHKRDLQQSTRHLACDVDLLPESLQTIIRFLKSASPINDYSDPPVEQAVAPLFKRKHKEVLSSHPLVDQLVASLSIDTPAIDIKMVFDRATQDFGVFSTEQRTRIIKTLGWAACAKQAQLTDSTQNVFRCPRCDVTGVGALLPQLQIPSDLLEASCAAITRCEAFKEDPSLKLEITRTLCRIARHAQASNELDLNRSSVIKYLHGNLCDSSRHIRMLTGNVLRNFFRYSDRIDDEKIYESNRRRVFDMLRKHVNDPKCAETLVYTWSQLGEIARPDDLQLILLTLVDNLCHANIFIRQTTVIAINRLARTSGQSTYMLFSPYMRHVSIQILDRAQKKPELINTFASILGISGTDLLARNQQHLLPPMVLHGMHEHIKSIARGTRRGVKEALLDNMAYILSHLLTSGYIKDGDLMRFLSAIDPAFSSITIEELINSHPIPLAAELLQLFAEKSLKRETILAALSQVGHISVKITSSTRKTPRDLAQENLRIFLRKHCLGIVSQCEESMNGFRGRRGILDRSRYITAIGELISLLGAEIEYAVPQITACLQAAMNEPGLRSAALSAWGRLIHVTPEDSCASLIPYSVCLFLYLFPNSTERERLMMKAHIQEFLMAKTRDFIKVVAMIPTLKFPELIEIEEILSENGKTGGRFRQHEDVLTRLRNINVLCVSDNPVVALGGLREMKDILLAREAEFHHNVLKEWKDPAIHLTIRNLLDIITKFKNVDEAIQLLAAECLGVVGAVDPVREDGAKKVVTEVVLHNFADEDAEETVKFVRILLEHQLINAFRSATRSNVQIFLAWAIQELLKFSGFDESVIGLSDGRNPVLTQETKKRWNAYSPGAREVLTPLLTSKYDAGERSVKLEAIYPIIEHAKNYNSWLFIFLYDLLQSAEGENAKKLFGVFARILRDEETTISNFLLPYVFLNVCVGCSEEKRSTLLLEIVTVLKSREDSDAFQTEYRRLASSSIFAVVDYLSLWSRTKKIWNRDRLTDKLKRQNKHVLPEDEDDKDVGIKRVHWLITNIPAKLMAEAALACKSYSRALFYWEQHIRAETTVKTNTKREMEPLLAHLQQLYININDPDGIEGVSSCLSDLSLEQEIMMHENAGRWTAAQSSYELALQEFDSRLDLQVGLLRCLKETGHHEVLLHQASKFLAERRSSGQQPIIDLALVSAWSLGQWHETTRLITLSTEVTYDTLLSNSLLALHNGDLTEHRRSLAELRKLVTHELASSNHGSTWQCYDSLAKLSVIHELNYAIATADSKQISEIKHNPTSFRNRLMIMASTSKWKQHLLTVRRVLVDLQPRDSTARLKSSIWLESAKLARKAGQSQQAYKAILNALELDGTPLAKIEHARWWWKEGHQMRAIQTLRKALEAKAFDGYEPNPTESILSIDASLLTTGKTPKDALISKAELLLTRWNDLAEHANSKQQLKEYTTASRGSQLEKPHYFMGRYYLRLLKAEAKKSPDQQDLEYLQGEYHRQVVMSYGRAMHFGVRYIFQTLPSYLQLWLDFGHEARTVHQKAATTGQRRQELAHYRLSHLASMNDKIKGFVTRLPTYLYMLAFPQILSRINHSEKVCYTLLEAMILKCLTDYPRQSLWPFMAVCKSRDSMRSTRGNTLIARLRNDAKKAANSHNLVLLSQDAQSLTDQLMHLCTVPVIKNRATLSLSRDLEFDVSVAPSNLVVPAQNNLTVVLPAQGGVGSTKHHRAFEEGQPTIASFKDEVDVMASLQRPRKVTVRASDGQLYSFLVKPNDDLRKDARLMDFNGVVQKFIRRDPEALTRLMKIRTYAVIALNEDHGLCEWVQFTRPLRDILVKTYVGRNILMQYGEVKTRMEYCLSAQHPGQAFETHVLKMFPPSFHDWFVEKFADPAQWFAARMSYSRTLAVMSMVGFVLGLGDRHGENILFDETTGDAVHVDFNCLFEKGHTFEKPEKVPFRLTHNMVDALGVTGVEGSFRKTCEITLRILRENQDAFNTVLESFLHDPVGEFLKKVKKSPSGEFEKAEAIKVLSVIANKLKGSAGAGIADKHVPLSIEGQADELIKQATDSRLLVQMYIGWTSWL